MIAFPNNSAFREGFQTGRQRLQMEFYLRLCCCLALHLIVGMVTGGCRTAFPNQIEAHDLPVPPSEPRQGLLLGVDLIPKQDCEEAFDLDMYRHRGIDLIVWRKASRPCSGRKAVVYFFPKRIDRHELIKLARGAARRVVILNEGDFSRPTSLE